MMKLAHPLVVALLVATVSVGARPLVVDIGDNIVSFVHQEQLHEFLATERLSVLAHVFSERFSLVDARLSARISVNSTLGASLRSGRRLINIAASTSDELELVVRRLAASPDHRSDYASLAAVAAPADACTCATGRATISSTKSAPSATLALQDIAGETWAIVASEGKLNTTKFGSGIRTSLGSDGTQWINGSVVSTASLTGARLSVSSDASVQGKLSVGGGLSATGDVSLTGGNVNAQAISVADATVAHDLIVTGKTTLGEVDIQGGTATTLTAHTLASTTQTTATLAATTSVKAPAVCAGARCLNTLSLKASTYHVSGGDPKTHDLGTHLLCTISEVHPHGWTVFDIELTGAPDQDWSIKTSSPQGDSAIMCFDWSM